MSLTDHSLVASNQSSDGHLHHTHANLEFADSIPPHKAKNIKSDMNGILYFIYLYFMYHSYVIGNLSVQAEL